MVSTDTDNIFCRILADILAAHGVKTVVCSPGSRNVPMLAAVDAHSELQTEIVIDERAAAFMALGLSLVGRRPVALVCTSGTALLNYAPAVAEAYYQGVPLIVISTDRPAQWIDQDDSQTLNQYEALRRFVKASYDIPSVSQPDAEMKWYVNRLANDAMIEACSRRQGPVHINLRLAPPLGGTTNMPLPQQRVISMLTTPTELSREQIDFLADEAAGCRILLIAGFTQPDARLNRAVTKFCTLPNVALMCETISNLHTNPLNYMVDAVLTTLTTDDLERLRPDLVITIGGALISRQVKEWIRRVRPQRHWTIGFTHTTVDALQSLTCRIEASPASVLSMLTGALKRRRSQLPSGYADEWQRLRRKANESAREYIESTPWSELTALAKVFRTIPSEYNLFLSNGTVIRYAQLLTSRLPHASYCNRGVSGIDGSTSTAVGGALGASAPTLLISGDMSLSYDLSGLALSQTPDTMRIIVLNNSGGGIFRFINAGVSEEMRERMLCTAPVLDLSRLAPALGWHYLAADSFDTLIVSLRRLFNPSYSKTLLEIKVPGPLSAALLKAYMHRTS